MRSIMIGMQSGVRIISSIVCSIEKPSNIKGLADMDKFSIESVMRNPVPNGPRLDEVSMLCTEITYVLRDKLPEIRLYGITESGNSVCAKISHFKPYFYVLNNRYSPNELEQELRAAVVHEKDRLDEYIHRVDPVQRIALMGYQHNGPSAMEKITLYSPKHVSLARQILERQQNCTTYEANVPYVLRFMVDMGIGGFDWIRLTTRAHGQPNPISTCQLEFDAAYIEKLEGKSDIAPIRILSFDLEACKGGNGRGFVDPEEDSISQIGCSLVDAHYNSIDECCFSLVPFGQSVSPVPGVRVITFESEDEMLRAFFSYIVRVDPDVLTGYNVDGFDWWYLATRCKRLGVELKLSRDPSMCGYLKKNQFSSAATGTRVDWEMVCEGRFTADVLKHMKNPASMLKYRSYSLGYVANKLLKDSKIDMPYHLIPVYQRGTDDQRAHLCYYCWWDARLCIDLMKNQNFIINYIETARVCAVPMKFIFTRGQQILTMSLLLRYSRKEGLVVPSSTENENDEDTQGATVLEPTVGLHTDPVVTLDFQSLYPSIIRYHNLCYSTIAPLAWAKKNLKPDDYFVPPVKAVNYCFVAPHIWRGILPCMETTLFDKRNQAKADLKAETDPQKKSVLDRRQNAIKLRMNAIYGFMKANMVCDKRLMETVCGVGRWMIESTKNLVESTFPNCVVVYGDTDSVFVKFIGRTIEEALELGKKAAALATQFFNKHSNIHALQLEKIYLPLQLVGKKKYVGRKFMVEGGQLAKPKCSPSGLETVRRDNALIASETLGRSFDILYMEGDHLDQKKRIATQLEIAVAFVHDQIRKLLTGRIPMSKLIISKAISKPIAKYDETGVQLPHIELAKKVNARKHETGEEGYYTGDRVKYVMVAGVRGEKSSQCSEDPLYVLQNRLPIDFDYYIRNQMMKPLLRIFTSLVNSKQTFYKMVVPKERKKPMNQEFISYRHLGSRRFEDLGKIAASAADGIKKDLTDKELECLDAYKRLFTGPHMRHKIRASVAEVGKVGIARFVKKLPQCLECHATLQSTVDGLPLCRSCAPKAQVFLMQLRCQTLEMQQAKDDAWNRCVECAKKGNFDPKMCGQKDCDNFYERTKLITDLEDLDRKLKCFGDE